ncbi:MAG: tRNA lysidine(34) synthetase TilS [Puniceicoccales bacterium]|jgi:tRNA(Ile)-lysidine synthase|nr:tRNA lysidine(34) synthetase TilS [Puniceicoccales bacterium]
MPLPTRLKCDPWAEVSAKLLSHEVLAVADEMPGAALCVACSGGSDSVALLHLLNGVKDLRKRLVVLHYDHGLREVTSQRDRIFVEALSQQLALPFFWQRRPSGRGGGEDELRRDRMAFFRETMANLSTPYVLTAHHRDDAIETLLLRLGRGSGLLGLTAPRAVQRFLDGPIHLRPLLHVAKCDLLKYLDESGLGFCEDETNGLPEHCRNRLRNELLPLWRTVEPLRDLDGAILATQKLLAEDCDALELVAQKIYGEAFDGDVLLLAKLRLESRAIVRRVLHRYFNGRGHTLRKSLTHALLEAIANGKKVNLSIDTQARCVSDGAALKICPRRS